MPTPTQPTDFRPKGQKKGKKQQKQLLKAIKQANTAGATTKPVTSAADWKRNGSVGLTDVEFPSGHVVQIKRVDLTSLLASGAFPDSLMSIIMTKLDAAKGNSKRDEDVKAMDGDALKEMMGDPKKMADLFGAFDKIAAQVIVQPPVKLHTDAEGAVIPADEREDDFVYTDDISMDDKSFLFQFSVGGTGELEAFREGRDSLLADVEDVEGAPQAP